MPTWKHLTSRQGDLPEPNGGKEQTTAVIFDIDGDGVNDFVLGERTRAPGLIWVRRTAQGWDKYVIDPEPRRTEAGGRSWDVDGDGTGNFTTTLLAKGFGFHEARVADLDGDGRADILDKPCHWDTPRVDVWLNQGNGP